MCVCICSKEILYLLSETLCFLSSKKGNSYILLEIILLKSTFPWSKAREEPSLHILMDCHQNIETLSLLV